MKRRVTALSILVAALLAAACAATARTTPGAAARTDTTIAPAGFTVVTLNIWHNQENWPARLAQMVGTLRARNPDVICLQEVLQNPELPNQAETIASQLGYRYYFASVDTPGSAKRYGNAILTRHHILAQSFHKLQPLNDYRVVEHIRIRFGADSIDIYNTHLHHAAQGGSEVRRTQLLDLLDFVERTRAHGPVVLAGDFNAPVTEPEVRTLAGQFVSAFDLLHGARDVTTLNPAKGHQRVRIDHIFYRHGPARALRPIAAEILFDRPDAAGQWASDHFGLLARFEIVGW